jgi:hypothetical protein
MKTAYEERQEQLQEQVDRIKLIEEQRAEARQKVDSKLKLKTMKLHEERSFETDSFLQSNWKILRVPGGWIYSEIGKNSSHFIPEHNV